MGDVLLNDTPVRKYAGWNHDVECHLDSLSFLHAVINESNDQTAQVGVASLSPRCPPSLPMKTALLNQSSNSTWDFNFSNIAYVRVHVWASRLARFPTT